MQSVLGFEEDWDNLDTYQHILLPSEIYSKAFHN
jgi:hypothetical protein